MKQGLACAALSLAVPLLGHAAAEQRIESCVSDDALSIGAADARAWLDAGDIEAATAAMGARYPVLQRDGFAPHRVLLWEQPGRGWLYVALLENPDKAGDVCFTATVSAATLGITKALLRKYFPGLSNA